MSGPVSFVVFRQFFFSKGRCVQKFSGANFGFWGSVWVLRVFVLFCLCFCFVFAFIAPETVSEKFSRGQVRCFWVVLSPPLVFPPTSTFLFFFFSREIAQVVIGHTPTRTLCFFFLFLSVSPPHLGLSPVFGRASFPSGVLSGCHSGPRAFFGFSRNFSDALFSDARRQGCFIASRACVAFPLFSFCFAASHLF